jgi:hypothetical protein
MEKGVVDSGTTTSSASRDCGIAQLKILLDLVRTFLKVGATRTHLQAAEMTCDSPLGAHRLFNA